VLVADNHPLGFDAAIDVNEKGKHFMVDQDEVFSFIQIGT
jgi:hypothetical protein